MGLSRSSLTESGAAGASPCLSGIFNAEVEAKIALDEDNDSEFSDEDEDDDDDAADEGTRMYEGRAPTTRKSNRRKTPNATPTRQRNVYALSHRFVWMLLESRHIRRVVTAADITNVSHNSLTRKRAQVAATILNCLRPYVPQRQEDNKPHPPHILLRVPIVFHHNRVFEVTGHARFIRRVAIRSLATARGSLPPTAAGFYQIASKEFDIPVTNLTYITSAEEATRKKLDVFVAFFDTDSLTAAMGKHGLDFAWRITYRDEFNVSFLGKIRPAGNFYHICFRRRTTKRNDGESDGRA
jgi:hypothetical protein